MMGDPFSGAGTAGVSVWRSLRTTLLFWVLVVTAIGMTVSTWMTVSDQQAAQTELLQTRAKLIAELQASALTGPMWNMDENAASRVVGGLTGDPDFAGAWIMDADGRRSAAQGLSEAELPTPNTQVSAPIPHPEGGDPLGTLHVALDHQGLEAARAAVLWDQGLRLAIFLAIIAVVVGVVITRATRALGDLTGALGRIAGGQIEQQVGHRDRPDEIGAIGRAVEVLRQQALEKQTLEARQKEMEAENTRARQQLLHDLAGRLEETVHGVAQAVGNAAQTLNRTARNMTDMASAATRQSGEARHAVNEAGSAVQLVASGTEELTAAIREISGQVGRSTEVARSAVTRAGEAADLMHSLEQTSQAIGEVVDLINDIASQTNLLALNATIEAARAGEAGKGFAVVASEVKSLANQTAKATEEISERIGQVQDSSRRAVEAIEAVQAVIAEIDSGSAGIAAAIEEQTATTGEISRAISAVAQQSDAVASNVDGLHSTVEQAGAAANQVLDQAGDLDREAHDLNTSTRELVDQLRAA